MVWPKDETTIAKDVLIGIIPYVYSRKGKGYYIYVVQDFTYASKNMKCHEYFKST